MSAGRLGEDDCISKELTECFKNGCKGNLAVTSVTPLITRIDSADLAGKQVSPFSLTSLCMFLLKLCAQAKRTTIPDRGGLVSVNG